MIKNETITALKVFIIFSVLTGIVYPLGITAIAQLTMADKANGSLIKNDNKVIGSKLIGQNFTDPKYFHSRPSAAGAGYDAASSAGTNLGPSSKKLMDQVAKQVAQVRSDNNIPNSMPLPADMVLTSASGLDPHISVENAMLQVTRVSRLNNISEDKVIKLIANNTDPDFLGIWGQPGVNVLKLNIALDKT
jgi:K+-transporting ATPase ATPase C chain